VEIISLLFLYFVKVIWQPLSSFCSYNTNAMNKRGIVTFGGLVTALAVVVLATASSLAGLTQQALAANDLGKVIKAANEGKDEKFVKTCEKAGGIVTPTACDLSSS
jgi:hypothetical protein